MSTLPPTPDISELLADAGWLRGLARRLVSDASLADDVLQDAWLSALRCPPRHDRAPRAWWAVVLRNAARQIARSEQARANREHLVARSEISADSPVDVVARAETHDSLVRAVLALPEPYRRVLLWRYFDERKASEIAGLLGVPASTVRSHLKRGLALLRERLEENQAGGRRAWALALIPLARTVPGAGLTTATTAGGFAVSATSKITLTAAALGLLLLGTVFTLLEPGSSEEGPSRADDALREILEPSGEPDPVEGPPLLASGPRAKTRTPTLDRSDPAFPAGLARIEGEVVDVRGLPVPGVAVALYLKAERALVSHYEAGASVALLDEAPGDSTRVVAFASSDAGGRFTFEGLDPTRPFRVRATPTAPLTTTEIEVSASAHPTARVRLVLGRGSPLAVRIVDADGEGRRGTVTLAMERPSEPGLQAWKSGARWTDARGRLTLSSVPQGLFRATVKVPGYGERTRVPLRVPATGEIVLSLAVEPGATVYGVVRDGEGGSVAKARILIRSGGYRHEKVPQLVRAATSDAQGRYRIKGLPPGRIVGIDCVADGFVRRRRTDYACELAEGGELKQDFDLERGSFVRGRVVTSAGEALPGAHVETSVYTGRGGSAYQLKVKADANGRYALGPLPRGRGVATALLHGYFLAVGDPAPFGSRRGRGHAYEFTEAGQELLVDLAMRQGTAIDGRVVDSSGKPVAGAKLKLIGPKTLWQSYGPAFEQVATDAAGAFRFAGLPPMGSFFVRVTNGTAQIDTEIQPDGKNLIVLPDTASISGRVIWPEGPPTGAWFLTVHPPEGRRRRITTRGEKGRFEVKGLPAGRTTLQILDGFRQSSGEMYEALLSAGQQVTDVELRPESLFVIEGVVVGPDGKPKVGHAVSVGISDAAQAGLTVRCDAEGRFHFPRLPEGIYCVSGEGISKQATVPAGTQDVRLVVDLVRPILEGTVYLPDGSPLPRGTLSVLMSRTANGESWYGVSVRAGLFQYRLPIGSTFAEVRTGEMFEASGRQANTLPFSKKVPVHKPLTIRLEVARSVPGIVVDGKGVGVAGVRIMAADVRAGLSTFNSPNQNVVTRADGRFELVGLGDATTVLVRVVSAPEGSGRPAPTTLGPDDKSIRIVLGRGGAIRGKVVDTAGTPLENVTLLGFFNGVSTSTRSGSDGQFVLGGVPPGVSGTVQVLTRDMQDSFLPMTIKNVETGLPDLFLALERGEPIRGRVVDPSGRGVGGAYVTLHGERTRRAMATSSDGTFRFDQVSKGRYTVTAKAHAGWAASLPVPGEVPGKEILLELRRGNVLEGRLLGRDLDGLEVALAGSKGSSRAVVSEDGKFRIGVEGTNPGTLLVIDKKHNRYAVLEGVVPPQAGLELVLRAALQIKGRLEGAPRGARVLVEARAAPFGTNAIADGRGAFVLSGLPPGTYTVSVMVMQPDGAKATREGVEAGTTGFVIALPEREGK